MSRVLFVYVTSLLLLAFTPVRPPKMVQEASAFSELRTSLKGHYQHKELADLTLAYLLGEKRWLNPKSRKIHKSMFLQHLFTPSGLHFGSLFLLLFPFRRRFKKPCSFLEGALCFLVYFLNGFFSIKRIAAIRLIKIFFPKASTWYSFLFIFLIDFIFGSYSFSPLSFIFSFLFLGALIGSSEMPKTISMLSLLGGQLIIGIAFVQSFSHAGFFSGLFISGLFTFLFPILILQTIFLEIFHMNFFGFSLEYFFKLLVILFEYIKTFPTFYPSIISLLSLFFLFSRKWRLSLFFLLIFSNSIYNLPQNKLKLPFPLYQVKLPPKNWLNDSRLSKKTVFLSYRHGISCKRVLVADHWINSCDNSREFKKSLLIGK